MSEMHYRSIIEFAEVPGYSDLSPDQKDVFGKVFSTARSVRANEQGQLVVDKIRVRQEKLSALEFGVVLGLLGTIGGLCIKVTDDKEVKNAKLVCAIPEDIKERLVTSQAAQKRTESFQDSGPDFSAFFKEIFGTKK